MPAKLSALSPAPPANSADLLYVAPAAGGISRKVTLGTLVGALPTNAPVNWSDTNIRIGPGSVDNTSTTSFVIGDGTLTGATAVGLIGYGVTDYSLGSGGITIAAPGQAVFFNDGISIGGDQIAGTSNTDLVITAGTNTNLGGHTGYNLWLKATAGTNNHGGGNVYLNPGAKDGGGTDGYVAIEQPGGTPGTNESRIFQSAASLFIENKDGGGNVNILSTNSIYLCYANNLGNRLVVSNYIGLGGLDFAWNNNSDGTGTTGPAFSQVNINAAGGVIRSCRNDGSQASWWQNTAGEAALASPFTDATGSLAATHLSLTLIAGRSYRIDGYFIVSNTTPADGFQMDFAGGSCSATTFNASITALGGSSDVAGTQVSAALNTVLNYTTVTGTDRFLVKGYIKVNSGGTLIIRAATNTHVSGTMTLAAGSYIHLEDTINL